MFFYKMKNDMWYKIYKYSPKIYTKYLQNIYKIHGNNMNKLMIYDIMISCDIIWYHIKHSELLKQAFLIYMKPDILLLLKNLIKINHYYDSI